MDQNSWISFWSCKMQRCNKGSIKFQMTKDTKLKIMISNREKQSRKLMRHSQKLVYYDILFFAILPTSVAGRNIKRVVNLSGWQQVLKHKYPVRY